MGKYGRIVVTGATGMIGRQVVASLECLAGEILGVSLDPSPSEFNWPLQRLDLTDLCQAREAVKGADLVVHVAGIKGSIDVTKSRPATFMTPMLQMNTNLAAASVLEDVSKVIFTSSIGVYPSRQILSEDDCALDTTPMDTYPGWAKRIAELHLESIAVELPGFEYAIVRPSNVYGPWDNFDPSSAMVIGALLGKARTSTGVIEVWGDGKAIRDFIYSADVADLIRRIADRERVQGVFNAGSGRRESIRELVDVCQDVTGREFMYTPERGGGFPIRVMDISRAQDELGWAPATGLRAGVEATWSWLLRHSPNQGDRLDYFANHLRDYQR